MESFANHPMWCSKECSIDHHPVLVMLYNCVDVKNEERLQVLKDYITEHGNIGITGIIPDPSERYCIPAIHFAAGLGRVSIVRWLLLSFPEATVTCTTLTGDTPLHHVMKALPEACLSAGAAIDVFKELLEIFEPNLTVSNAQGYLPVHFSCKLLSHYDSKKAEFHSVALPSVIEKMKEIFTTDRAKLEKLLNRVNDEGDNCLHVLVGACKHQDRVQQSARMLLECGVKLNTKNKRGQTVCDKAMACGALKLMKLLGKYGPGDSLVETTRRKKKPRSVMGFDSKGNVIKEKLVAPKNKKVLKREAEMKKYFENQERREVTPPLPVVIQPEAAADEDEGDDVRARLLLPGDDVRARPLLPVTVTGEVEDDEALREDEELESARSDSPVSKKQKKK